MKREARRTLLLVGLMAMWPLVAPAEAQTQSPPQVKIPQPGVSQIMTMEGRFVRVAYNNEGYVIIGYQVANRSIGEKWLLLDVGMTVREGVPNYKLTREALSLETPDGKTIPLPTVEEFRSAHLGALQKRAEIQRDPINYFPPGASRPCRIGFFSDIDSPAMAWDEVELGFQRACLGRLYFQVPGGIAYGQHWLNVKFKESLVRVPFRILTEEEEKLLSKNYKEISKQVEDAFKK